MWDEEGSGGAGQQSLQDVHVPLLGEGGASEEAQPTPLERPRGGVPLSRRFGSWSWSWRGPVGPALLLLLFQMGVLFGGVALGIAYLWRSLQERGRGDTPYGPPGAYEGGRRGGGGEGQVWLVETLPLGGGLELEPIQGTITTPDALLALVGNSTTRLDVTAMYWSLVPTNTTGASLGPERLEALGSDYGARLLQALYHAAGRGVLIRVLQDKSVEGDDGSTAELWALQRAFPQQVQVQQWDGRQWFGEGIMHMKLWVADGQWLYVGSANMDWRSLAQVKEVGVLVAHCPLVAQDAQSLFDDWWHWAAMSSQGLITTAYVAAWQAPLTMPCWSTLVPVSDRCACPWARRPGPGPLPSSLARPLHVSLNGSDVAVSLSGSPVDLVQPGGGRSSELRALLHTITSAQAFVSLSVMDWAPTSLYHQQATLWWSELWDALLGAALTRGVRVRLLVAQWQHTSPTLPQYLRALQQTAANTPLQIKVFAVPGWDSTTGPDAQFPPYSRVTHGKYAVSEQEASISTSNMAWDYYYRSAGATLTMMQQQGVRAALEALFDRDWDSSYATALQ